MRQGEEGRESAGSRGKMRNNVAKHEIMAGLCNLALGWSSLGGISFPFGPAFNTHFYTHELAV